MHFPAHSYTYSYTHRFSRTPAADYVSPSASNTSVRRVHGDTVRTAPDGPKRQAPPNQSARQSTMMTEVYRRFLFINENTRSGRTPIVHPNFLFTFYSRYLGLGWDVTEDCSNLPFTVHPYYVPRIQAAGPRNTLLLVCTTDSQVIGNPTVTVYFQLLLR